ncbi:trypsin-like peptidase domain-containing protein [Peptoniphilus equinus]|uniref:Trypsin-like peptidase domain-containing protein n=1 Tax=Peptoniphilus equinus TaxID=3016343 RepID=A0ABY7QUE8_9FIRM|nr:trypsin-like peptidase domain-containing protein [Peptoniphilus equinus]WBW50407.1 trypsin-like peptidase domain-containing protein [Peptoniphilus equinus]
MQTNNNRYKKKQSTPIILILVVAILGSVLGSAITYAVLNEQRGADIEAATSQPVTIQASTETTVAEAVAQKAIPSTVGITTEGTVDSVFGQVQAGGTGSGVIIDAGGYILTNAHVVKLNGKSADNVSVLLNDGQTVKAKPIWVDSSIDIAIIKVDTDKKLVAAELGDSDKLNIGEPAIAIGNPFDLAFQRTVTQGIVSGLNRYMGQVNGGGYMSGLIQTDASINPGNSGGPLLNQEGKVIGINTVKVNTAEGLGFAIPINSLKPIIKEVIETGNYRVVSLGVQSIDMAQAKAMYNIRTNVEGGILVLGVIDDTPAAAAGLKRGDVILSMDGEKLQSANNLKAVLYKYQVGSAAELEILRDGKVQKVQVTFSEYSVSDDAEANKDNRFMLPDIEQ